jgi:lipoprotein-anchoring transpeptidase ErfK/SrfK
MRKSAFAFTMILFAAPASAQNNEAPAAIDPITVAQLQGPSVIRAPRYVAEPQAEQQPQPRRNQRRNARHQEWDSEQEAPPRHYQQQQPVAQVQYQQQQQYYQQPRQNLGGGFIEFLVTGNSNQRQQAAPQPQPQGYYYPPQQQQYYQHNPMTHSRQAPPHYQQQYQHVARTDPQEQPQRPSFDPRYERTEVEYKSDQPVGSIIIDTRTRYLYLIQPNGRAIRYGVGVGRPGFEWKGVKTVSAMKEWPDWRPPQEMRKRQPYLPEHMAGGPNNPLGARAIYLGSSLYRIHGSNEPHTIGSAVSSGCFRMRNQDVIDLYGRVRVGARVVVL